MSKIYCRVCGKIVDRKHDCTTDVKKENKKDLRKSYKWQRLREQVLEEQNYICLFSFAVYGRIVVANEVHHIISVSEDSEKIFEDSNLIGLNREIHRMIQNDRRYETYLSTLRQRYLIGELFLGCDKDKFF